MLAIENEENGPLLYCKSLVRRAILSVGSNEYRELHIDRGDGQEEEVIYGGEFACAYHTTAMLHNFGLLEALHTTVDGFEQEVTWSEGWRWILEAQPGAIGILEGKIGLDGVRRNRHTFICIGDGECVHNDADPAIRSPQRIKIADFTHHDGSPRKVQAYYIHEKLM